GARRHPQLRGDRRQQGARARVARRGPADRRGQEPVHRLPGARALPAARHPHAAHRREHRRARQGARQRHLLLQPRRERQRRAAASRDPAGAHGGARPASAVGDDGRARPRVRLFHQDEVLVMAARHVLYFTAENRILYRAERHGLELVGKFSADEAGLEAFGAHLRGERSALLAVLADLAGEDFHEEQIPCVRGADRQALLARRLAQRYRDTRLAAALPLGVVQAAERRNERVLLASFTNTQQLAPWLDALEEAGARLAGVYSAPLLAPALAAALGARQARL